jgi:catechol 2,3-dioxygenase-like lactoylglutathione lyase family enzyme
VSTNAHPWRSPLTQLCGVQCRKPIGRLPSAGYLQPVDPAESFPKLRQVVLDTMDVRMLAEFYRRLLGWRYRPGDEPSGVEESGGDVDWLVLHDDTGAQKVAFQQVPYLPPATWPDGPHQQMMHLDLTVPTVADLNRQDARARALGARLLLDRSADPEEPLRVYADPAGHPFCIFVGSV